MLRVQSLTVEHGTGAARVTALRDVSASFAPGEIAAVVGPSGSGKSTLLSVLSGLKRPTSGEVWLDDQCVSALSASALAELRRRSFGLIFQSFRLLRHVSVLDNLRVAAEVIGVPRASHVSAAMQALEVVGLAEKASRALHEISGGEKQRVAIARALLGHPRVLLADEPTAALDWTSGRRCFELLHRLSREAGCAVVIVTHDQRLAEACDTVWRLNDGHLRPGGDA